MISWYLCNMVSSLRWRHNDHAGVSNHQPHGCLLNRLFRRKSKKTSKLRVTGLCAGNSPGTGEFPAQMASYAENVSIWWRHHVETLQFPSCIALLYHWLLTIIASENGLSPGRRQAIIWYNDGILLIWPLGTNFSEILIEIHSFSFKKMHLKMLSGKWWPFCLGFNV